MTDLAVKVESLSKRYRIGTRKERHDTLRDQIVSNLRSLFGRSLASQQAGASDSIWALKDVSFEVKQGEVLGIIGRNGAGKSTLLKILSRITEPTSGRVEIDGRIASLLEVGTGFHPELTGRENVYLNGTILGMKRAEINRKFDEIVAFAGIEQFLDTPVKRYSSGMYVRLAFAVAAHLEPEILIVDEVLAVGDAGFQRKCLSKMQDVAKSGRTVLFVSHNLAAMQALCTRGLFLSEGRVKLDGPIADAVKQYVNEYASITDIKLLNRTDREGDGLLYFTDFWLEDGQGMPIKTILTGQDVRFCFAYQSKQRLSKVHVAFNLHETIGDPLVNCNTADVGQDFDVEPGVGVIVCEVKRFPLRSNRYTGNIFCRTSVGLLDWVKAAFQVEVEDGDFYGTGRLEKQGKMLLMHSWTVDTKSKDIKAQCSGGYDN
jgi:lipopolysaccharide transport system ATP-binding protein